MGLARAHKACTGQGNMLLDQNRKHAHDGPNLDTCACESTFWTARTRSGQQETGAKAEAKARGKQAKAKGSKKRGYGGRPRRST